MLLAASCLAKSDYWILGGVVLVEDYVLLTLMAYNSTTVPSRSTVSKKGKVLGPELIPVYRQSARR